MYERVLKTLKKHACSEKSSAYLLTHPRLYNSSRILGSPQPNPQLRTGCSMMLMCNVHRATEPQSTLLPPQEKEFHSSLFIELKILDIKKRRRMNWRSCTSLLCFWLVMVRSLTVTEPSISKRRLLLAISALRREASITQRTKGMSLCSSVGLPLRKN